MTAYSQFQLMFSQRGSLLLDLGRQGAIIPLDFVMKVKFLRILKDMIPVRDIFPLHNIYILFFSEFSFSFYIFVW